MKKLFILLVIFCITSFTSPVALAADGDLDQSITLGGRLNAPAISIHRDVDDKMVLTGYFQTYDGSPSLFIVRLNNDGTRDSSYQITAAGLDGPLTGAVTQSDGKVVATGFFQAHNQGVYRHLEYITRFNTDGVIDTGYSVGCLGGNSCAPGTEAGFNAPVFDIAIQSDNKVIVSGQFSLYKNNAANNLARINTDGSFDNTFAIGTGFNGTIYSVAVQPSDDKVIVLGDFTSYNGSPVKEIVRLNTDGSLDTTFSNTISFDGTMGNFNGAQATDLFVQADGKIFVGGQFTSFNGTPREALLRLNSDGTLDTTFVTQGTGFDDVSSDAITVGGVATQSDGKLWVASFTQQYNSISTPFLFRLENSIETIPDVPSAPDLVSDDGDSSTDNITTVSTPTFTGICSADEVITLYKGSTALTPEVSCASGAYTITLDNTLTVGVHAITATATNTMGESDKSPILSITIIENIVQPQPSRTRVVGGGGGSRPVVTTPAPSTDMTDCKTGDMFSATTGARCSGSTSPTTPTTPVVPSVTTFTKVLNQGMTDPEVKLLQTYLNTHGTPVALMGVGSKGMETNFFGPATKAALIRFQELNAKDILTPLGLTKGTGVLAAKTIAFMNAH